LGTRHNNRPFVDRDRYLVIGRRLDLGHSFLLVAN
jgi:hypothetical protein